MVAMGDQASLSSSPSPSAAPDLAPAGIATPVVSEAHLWLCLQPVCGLEPFDFSRLFAEKLEQHHEGTREWAFAELIAWLKAAPDLAGNNVTAMLACLLGSGGTGKSVLTAVLMSRVSERVVAWHFCRHYDKEKSAPAALLRSLAAMLCHRLPGYEAALGEVSAALLSSTDPKELF